MTFENTPGETLRDLIDKTIEERQCAGESTNEPRFHLGASQIGDECARARWYGFRWASQVTFEGRILRLFDRGHKEERRFIEWLELVGAEIRPTAQQLLWHAQSHEYIAREWDYAANASQAWYENDLVDVTMIPWHHECAKRQGVKVRQWGFVSDDGHFAGSGDGKGRHIPGQDLFVPFDEWILIECKTHNDRSFALIIEKGVQKGKPEHYEQVQHYMSRMGLRLVLYMAVNKNTEHMHLEFIRLDPAHAPSKEHHIREAIYSPKPPKRISASPSWFKCKMCDHRRTCQFGDAMKKNCRTCVHASPVDNGEWRCHRWGAIIPKQAQLEGCDEWKQIQD